ncbi:hypothetical protein PFMALIP_06255 [Plasmodium falciparum MaliPS096_E11]|uniref:Uncharacterized protein n=1 Tax=Plasmodium falciparum MaliPS096_E11 TaxID=1036727 RepID=A0A024WG74_PLAFA|nr:hypothetical protein PFMALIP_06255 [Plasmodium falciparum MaliPS096_E11]
MHNDVEHNSFTTTILTYVIIILLLRSIMTFILPKYNSFLVQHSTYFNNNVQHESFTTTLLT